ncbi:hypothetical protein CLOM_g6950 [Closterium sp. NIES-68]|nr:hypothetical protein CLOM_g6950 [Closterium sp. NIES-68]GJP67368.1 hypothetical protein CLOP_g24190 [Closterium sp. NIES-67]
MAIPVDSKNVRAVELYCWLPVARRLDVWPFAVVYAVWLALLVTRLRLDFTEMAIVTGALVSLNILTALFTVWSVDFRCFAHARQVSSVHEAEVCKVIPSKFGGSKEVVPLTKRQHLPAEKHLLGAGGSASGASGASGAAAAAAAAAKKEEKDKGEGGKETEGEKRTSIVKTAEEKEKRKSEKEGEKEMEKEEEEVRMCYRRQQFMYDEEERVFKKLRFPSKETFGAYVQWKGYGTHAKVEAARHRWGRNAFEFPAPTFLALFKEQCSEPFFVFQVFCVALWCMDEYWYYSIFTLFMLLVFESTVVASRLRTLSELRRVRVDTQGILVHREGKWLNLTGPDLVPGDIVSIGRTAAGHAAGAGAGGKGKAGPAAGGAVEDRTVPADLLLLAGTVIANEAILTGESTPQWKTPASTREGSERVSVRRDKAHVLFSGTKILQHTPDKTAAIRAPDGGCVAVVLRTGFDTSQGKLMRTILFSTDRVTANSAESGLFILFLVVFAVVAAGYVLHKGLEDPHRSRYKLFLNCSLIITSVIPPELPMELSIAVNTSLIALVRQGIYCTEPFRIPFAGKVDICCFDKTGTLTSDDMEFRGVVGAEGGGSLDLSTDCHRFPLPTLLTLAACHSLVFVDNKLVGDPLEKAALTGVDWGFTAEEKAHSRKGVHHEAGIICRHHFASHLKRMAVIARVDNEPGFMVLVKGAPETIMERLSEVPMGYSAAYKQFTRQGARVLALAYKPLPDMTVTEARALERDDVESNLTFAGFAVFACPIRSDSAAVLAELRHSSHDLVMITGDQALTACHVAGQVNIVTRPVLVLTPAADGGFNWLSPDEVTCMPYREEEVEGVSEEYDLCVAGDGIAMLQRCNALSLVIPRTQVFARVSPEQKEVILATLKDVGRVTLMCGDGTNDVGALKRADVGVALLNAVPPAPTKSSGDAAAGHGKHKRRPGQPHAASAAVGGASGATAGGSLASAAAGSSTAAAAAAAGGPGNARLSARELHQRKVKEQQEKLQKLMKELEDGGDGRAPVVKLGDASMASPFTAKHASVKPTRDILRQGRATLVTTLQMFKILGLNCLATAYVMSVMYLDGVKLGDTQATISGVFTAAFFLFLSQAKPLNTLSPERPHPNVFSAYVLISILGQFAIHLTFLMTAVSWAQTYMPEECIEPDSTFSPNLVNTVSYMANMMIQVATFAVNYIGHPFNQSIRENTQFFYALSAAAVFFTVVASDTVRELNDSLELVKLPQPLGVSLLGMAALMFVGCYAWERLLRWCFPVRPVVLRGAGGGRGRRKSAGGGIGGGAGAGEGGIGVVRDGASGGVGDGILQKKYA